MNKKINTMAELSAILGMSRATLSKYFQDPISVRKTTRKKIEDCLKEHDYVPNFFARNLNRQNTGQIGIVIPTLSDMFFTSLVEAVQRCAKSEGYRTIIQVSNQSPKEEVEALEVLRSMNVDGIIVAPIGIESDVASFERLGNNFPLVQIDSHLFQDGNGLPFVGTDNEQSVRVMVSYLCRTGNPPIFFKMPVSNSNAKFRAQEYATRMTELGFTPKFIEPINAESRWNFETYAYDRIRTEFQLGNYMDATILCANDLLAFGVIKAANEFGLFKNRQGNRKDFRVAGHDNHPLSSFVWPPLTTISQDTSQIGKVAFQMLINQGRPADLRAGDSQILMLPGLLELRESA